MPVQINEVIIRAVVDTQPSGSPERQNAEVSPCQGGCLKEELLEQVLEIIQESKER
ncbi:MAG: DUF5908 family protein [Chlorobium sp.]